MGFIEDLKSGRPGLQLAIPDNWQVHEDQQRRAVLLDNERHVGWHLQHAPFYLDLRPEHEAALHKDLERHARHAFAEQYAQLTLPPEFQAQRAPVRTADPAWPGFTPVVSIERTEVGGQPALLVLRRLVYERGMEVVLGSLLLPVASGTCELTAFHRAAETGQREALLMDLAVQMHPGQRPDVLARQLGQKFFDDPAQDSKFPQHPLSLVRRALAWLREPGRLTVTAAMPVFQKGEVELTAASSVLVPPPRYLPVPKGNLPAPPTMSVLARVGLEAAEHPQLLDVWLLPDVLIPPGEQPARQEALLNLARRTAADWERQGATDIKLEVSALPAQDGQVRAAARLRMMLGGAAAQSVSRWVADDDGVVVRLAVGAPIYIPIEEMEEVADQALRSWRRLKPLRTAWLTSDLRLRPETPAQA